MRHLNRAIVLFGLTAILGCQGTTTPERRELSGSWETTAFPGATIRMTLTETAREVRGAGSWLTVVDAYGFGIGGALTGDEFSLLFTFDNRPDINFQGSFDGEDILKGRFAGDGYRREQQVIFERIDLSEELDGG